MIQNVKLEAGSCYCVTFNTVDWVDIFIRPVYKQIIVHTLNHFANSSKIKIYGWCLMTNHLHLLVHPINSSIADFEKEFKSFTTKKILEAINTEPLQRRKWMLQRFEEFCKMFGLVKKYNIWQNSSRPLFIDFEKVDVLIEHFDFLHLNPVRDKIVDLPEEYLYSSARDYSGTKGLVKIEVLVPLEEYISSLKSMSGNFLVKYIRN